MKGDIVPDIDHVARYCKPSTLEDGQLLATAFLPRPQEESLSVNWLEYLRCPDRRREVAEIQKIYNKKFLKVRPNARIVVLNVGETRLKVLIESEDKRNLEFQHDPEEMDPSHSGIYNIKSDEEMIAELILSAVLDHHLYPAKA